MRPAAAHPARRTGGSRVPGLFVAVLLCAAATGCGGDDGPPPSAAGAPSSAGAEPTSQVPPSQTPPAVLPEQLAAEQTVQAFLTAVVRGEHEVAYALLSAPTQQALTLADYSLAQERRNGSARNLTLFEVTDVDGEGELVTVTASGRVADGTRVELVVPVRSTADGLRVEGVPAGI